jgi:hypothetical protein
LSGPNSPSTGRNIAGQQQACKAGSPRRKRVMCHEEGCFHSLHFVLVSEGATAAWACIERSLQLLDKGSI